MDEYEMPEVNLGKSEYVLSFLKFKFQIFFKKRKPWRGSIINMWLNQLAKSVEDCFLWLFFSVFILLGSLEHVQNMWIHQNLNIKFDIPLTPGVC